MIFFDWCSISQRHRPGTLPIVGTEYRSSTSLETGELVRETVTGFVHPGSFDTSLHIRSDGSAVSVSGNPSAYDRMDNLFGFSSIHECVDVINNELDRYSLPSFNSDRPQESLVPSFQFLPRSPGMVGRAGFVSTNGRLAARTDTLLSDDRARLSRVDLTHNLRTDDARRFLRHISTYVHHGKPGDLKPDGCSVTWGEGSRRVYIIYYDKAQDIQRKIAQLHKQKNSRHWHRIEPHIDYLTRLKCWCLENGIVRCEVKLKSTELIDRKLIHIESWDYSTMTNVIRPYQFYNKLNIEQTRFDDIAEFLIERGCTPRVARQAEMIHSAWIQGKDVKKLCSTRTTFYRYRKIISLIGVDIMNPCDISRITLRASRSHYESAEPPEWYQVSRSKLAA